MNIQEFLGRSNVPFQVLQHRETFDAQRMAQCVHESGHHVAKTVLLRVDRNREYVVAVLPASHNLDFAKVANLLSSEQVELATELELAERCPDCEIGALPPFGSHYGMRTVVDEALTKDEEIVFEGLTHTESIKMKYHDFDRLEHPTVASLSA